MVPPSRAASTTFLWDSESGTSKQPLAIIGKGMAKAILEGNRAEGCHASLPSGVVAFVARVSQGWCATTRAAAVQFLLRLQVGVAIVT